MSLLRAYFHRGSIRFRLFRLVVLITTTALLFSVVGGALFEWHNQQRQLTQSLSAIARAAGVAASAAVAFKDDIAARKALAILGAQKEIEAAALFPLTGGRLAGYGDETKLPLQPPRQGEQQPQFSLFAPSTTLFAPIWLDDAIIGHIFIRASLKDYHQNFLLQVGLAMAANLLVLLLVLTLGLRLLDSIVKPVKDLADTSRQVREAKNFSLRASNPARKATPDEIGELVVSFNAMLAEIESRDHSLQRYHNSLEQMVEERTRALQTANRELRSAKEAAETAMVSKSRFLAAASHDLRQPIQAIKLFKHALDKTRLDGEQTRISDYLSRSIHSLGELLDALLDISKLDAGVIVPKPEAISAHSLFSRIDAEFTPMASAKSLRFKFYFPAQDTSLFTDSQLLQSLLRNLIDNALKYTRKGGVLVALRRRSDHALIQVWDTGIAISPEHLETIFDEYFQIGNPERDKEKGLGLGLAIAKRQARLLGSEISCRSRIGRGSVFEFRLPLSEQPMADETPPTARELTMPRLAGRRVAVIEDDPMVARAIQLSLNTHGIVPRLYGNAEEALADPNIASADFYISDFRLPGADGAQLLDAIQKRAGHLIKAVLLTGETAPDWLEITQEAHWPVLFKPVDLAKLLMEIETQDLLA